MPGQYGNETVSVLNLKIARVDAEKDLLLVEGGIPGSKNGLVLVRHGGEGHAAPQSGPLSPAGSLHERPRERIARPFAFCSRSASSPSGLAADRGTKGSFSKGGSAMKIVAVASITVATIVLAACGPKQDPNAPSTTQSPTTGKYGQPMQGAPGYGQPMQGAAPGYGQPAPGYGQAPAGYGAPGATMGAPTTTAPTMGGAPSMGGAPATGGAPQLATPGPLALPCSSDAQCGLAHCNTQYSKCAFPASRPTTVCRGTSATP